MAGNIPQRRVRKPVRSKSVALPLREILRFERRSSHWQSRHRKPGEHLCDLAFVGSLRRGNAVQPTALAEFFSGTGIARSRSLVRVRTPGRLFEAHKAKSRLHRIFGNARPRPEDSTASLQHYVSMRRILALLAAAFTAAAFAPQPRSIPGVVRTLASSKKVDVETPAWHGPFPRP